MNQVKTFFVPLLLVLLAGAAWWPVEGRNNAERRQRLADNRQKRTEEQNASAERNAAATKIQSAWKGRQARQEAEMLRQAEARLRAIRKDRAEEENATPDSNPPKRRTRSKREEAVDHNRELTDQELMHLGFYRTKASGQILNAGKRFQDQVGQKTLTFGLLNDKQLEALGYQKTSTGQIVPLSQGLPQGRPLPPILAPAGG